MDYEEEIYNLESDDMAVIGRTGPASEMLQDIEEGQEWESDGTQENEGGGDYQQPPLQVDNRNAGGAGADPANQKRPIITYRACKLDAEVAREKLLESFSKEAGVLADQTLVPCHALHYSEPRLRQDCILNCKICEVGETFKTRDARKKDEAHSAYEEALMIYTSNEFALNEFSMCRLAAQKYNFTAYAINAKDRYAEYKLKPWRPYDVYAHFNYCEFDPARKLFRMLRKVELDMDELTNGGMWRKTYIDGAAVKEKSMSEHSVRDYRMHARLMRDLMKDFNAANGTPTKTAGGGAPGGGHFPGFAGKSAGRGAGMPGPKTTSGPASKSAGNSRRANDHSDRHAF